jgi:hypothetical protein
LVAVALRAEAPTALDRQHLIAHFQMTESWMEDEVSHLSEQQAHFHASPDSWSAFQCLEHLNLSDPIYWETYKRSIAGPLAPDGSPSSDLTRLWYGIDRSAKEKAPDEKNPKSEAKTIAASLAEFKKRRAEMLEYIRATQEDWRHHLVPGWNRDCYQWLLMISTHAQRMILQLREVKHSPNFPKQ